MRPPTTRQGRLRRFARAAAGSFPVPPRLGWAASPVCSPMDWRKTKGATHLWSPPRRRPANGLAISRWNTPRTAPRMNSAMARWARRIWRVTACWTGWWRSRSLTQRWRPAWGREPVSCGRRGGPEHCATRTWPASSSTACARPMASRSTRWSSSRARRWRSGCAAGVRCPRGSH